MKIIHDYTRANPGLWNELAPLILNQTIFGLIRSGTRISTTGMGALQEYA